MRNTKYILLIIVLIITLGLSITRPTRISQAAPILTLTPITWDIIGLDKNEIIKGPNIYPVSVRLCNSGDTAASTIIVNFVWDDSNGLYINLVGTSTQLLTSLSASTCHVFYYTIEITRNTNAYNTSRAYHITATAQDIPEISTPTPRQLWVEPIEGLSNTTISPINGPTLVQVGQIYNFSYVAQNLSQYEQLVHAINFPQGIFEIVSISASYTSPAGGLNDRPYADACQWDSNPLSLTYRTCIGTNSVGGDITVIYTVRIIGIGNASLSTLLYGYSTNIYQYITNPNIQPLNVTAFDPNTFTKTPTATASVTNTPTFTGTPPTYTATLTPTATGTQPTSTATGTIYPTLASTKAVNATLAHIKDEVTFTIRVENKGLASAKEVILEDYLTSPYFTLTASSATASKGTPTTNVSTKKVTVNIGTLLPKEYSIITIKIKINNVPTQNVNVINYATISYVYGTSNPTTQTNTITLQIQVTSTLPGTGGIELSASSSNLFEIILAISLTLILIGSGIIAYSVRARRKTSPWASWFTRTGLILLISGVLFGALAWSIKPAQVFQPEMSQSSNQVDNGLSITSGWSPTEEGTYHLVPQPIEPDKLPDFPIPTPILLTPVPAGQSAPDTSPVVKMMIPTLGLDAIVKYVPFDGLSWKIAGLKEEIAWMGDTSWPGLGGNTGLAGHVTLRDGSDGPFRNLDLLQPGELVTISTEKNIYTYQVREQKIVNDDDFTVVKSTDKSQLTLITCIDWDNDLRMYLKRLVIYADLTTISPIQLQSQQLDHNNR